MRLEHDLLAAADRYADQPALRAPTTGLSYRQFAAHVATLAAPDSPLAQTTPGTAALCLADDPIHTLAHVYACARLGLLACPLDPHLKPAERERLTTLAASLPPAAPAPRLFYLGFTSGSTGAPRGVLRTQSSWARSFRLMSEAFGLSHADRILVPGNLAHSFFLTAALHGLSVGAEVLCLLRFVIPRLLAFAARHQPTALYLVPSMANRLLDATGAAEALASVRTVVVAGARWLPTDRARLQALLPRARLLQYYGSSEMGFVSLATPADAERHSLAVGRLLLGVEVAIRDEQDLDLPPGQPGLIHARSPYTFARYLHEPSTTPPRDASGAWVTSDDHGYLDPEGYLHLVGRQDERIDVGGQKVFAAEVEQALLAHPAVRDALVVGLPHPHLGQVVGALAEADVAAADLGPWLRARLSTYKLPRRLLVVPRLPRTANGKPALARARALLGAHSTAPPNLHGRSGTLKGA